MAWTRVRASGKFQGAYKGPDGKDRYIGTSPDEKVALRAAMAEESKVIAGTWLDPNAGNMTFGDYFENRWINARTLEVNGRETYWSLYRACLKEKFGTMPLKRITRPMVQDWVNDMEAKGKKPRLVHARLALLQTVLAAKRGVSAMVDGLITDNPCYGITFTSEVEREVEIYTPDQVEKLVDALPRWFRLMIWFDSETGLRWGELLGMRVADIDFLRKKGTVRQTIVEQKVSVTGTGTRFMVKDRTKSGKVREVAISDDTLEMLSEHIKVRKLGREDLLFAMPVLKVERTGVRTLIEEVDRTDVWTQGLPISRSYFKHVWTKAVRKAGVPYRRRHDLRASFISWLLDNPDLSPQQVMDIAGHRQWATTRKYARSLDRTHEMGIKAIEDIRRRYREA